MNNILPTKDNLANKGIHCDLLCPMCEDKMETIDHCFMVCTKASHIWFGSQLSINFLNNSNQNFKDWIMSTIPKFDDLNTSQIINIIDNIWIARNIKIFENKSTLVEEILARINQGVSNYYKVHNPNNQNRQRDTY